MHYVSFVEISISIIPLLSSGASTFKLRSLTSWRSAVSTRCRSIPRWYYMSGTNHVLHCVMRSHHSWRRPSSDVRFPPSSALDCRYGTHSVIVVYAIRWRHQCHYQVWGSHRHLTWTSGCLDFCISKYQFIFKKGRKIFLGKIQELKLWHCRKFNRIRDEAGLNLVHNNGYLQRGRVVCLQVCKWSIGIFGRNLKIVLRAFIWGITSIK